jgi:TDG/mug DNA glycosylase family protein
MMVTMSPVIPPGFWRPTKSQLRLAAGKRVPDLIVPALRVLFCGINPGLYSAAVGHHFARPGNRFWPALYRAGFTDRLLSPFEEHELLHLGIGITNIVDRASASAESLSGEDLTQGAGRLRRKIGRCQPMFTAFLGITAFRKAFQLPRARLGRSNDKIGNSWVWLLPNPSGLNAHYQLGDLVHLFAELRQAVIFATQLVMDERASKPNGTEPL